MVAGAERGDFHYGSGFQLPWRWLKRRGRHKVVMKTELTEFLELKPWLVEVVAYSVHSVNSV
jgi:hypothetical protein